MGEDEKTTIVWTYDAEIEEDGAYVTAKLDGQPITTYGPMPPEEVTRFVEQMSAWAKDLASRVLTDLVAGMRAQATR